MVLLRFSSDEYITRLQKEGQLFCNSIQEFVNFKDEQGRGDDYENVFEQFYFENGILNIKPSGAPYSEFKELHYTNQSIKMMSTSHYVNVFCLYSLDKADYNIGESFELSDEIKAMGTHCLFIFGVNSFLEKVIQAAEIKGLAIKMGLVNYKVFEKYSGKKTIFEKPIKYAFQKEFRIAIKNTCKEPVELFIGNIEDITKKFHVSELKNISFGYKD